MRRTLSIGTVLLAAAMVLAAGCKKDQPKDEPTKEEPAVKGGEEPGKQDPDKKEPARGGPAAGGEEGVGPDEIKVGVWSPQTGPAALWGSVARGTAAYFELLNEAGGIHGRKLHLLIRDDGYQPARTKTAVMELVEKEKVFAFVGGVGTATGMAVKDYLAEKKIPMISPASGSSKWAAEPIRTLFSLYPTYTTEGKALVRHLLEKEKKEKIAVFYQNDDYGKEGMEAVKAELEQRGKKLLAAVSAEMTDQDLSSHILKLKQAKPDAVIMFVLPKHAAIALGTAAKLKFKPQWASCSTLSDAPLMHRITKGLWDGVVFSSFIELPDSDHPLVQKYRAEAYEKYGKSANAKEQWGIFFLAGIYFAEPFVEAVKLAGKDLTREKLIEALESLKAWKGGIGHEITFGPQERQGSKSVFIAKCEKGKAVKVSDWIKIED